MSTQIHKMGPGAVCGAGGMGPPAPQWATAALGPRAVRMARRGAARNGLEKDLAAGAPALICGNYGVCASSGWLQKNDHAKPNGGARWQQAVRNQLFVYTRVEMVRFAALVWMIGFGDLS